MKKIAVIVFNLGGPDQLSSVEPFLFNLFSDRAIIDLPNPFRWMLAKFITNRRGPKARGIYEKIGGQSPLLDLTREQASALEQSLNQSGDDQQFKTFVAMRYWHPMSDEVAGEVSNYGPDEIVLLPLYPQYSTSTTGSSFADWKRAAQNIGLKTTTKTICCYPQDQGWVDAQCALITKQIDTCAGEKQPMRILFSAHGLPKKIIDRGDPYQWQVEQTCAAVMEKLNQHMPVEHRLCYQSRVGRLEWIGPSIDEELERAAKDNVGVIVVPIAFVSEHSETLVELDIDYRKVAKDLNIPRYERVPAVATHELFIQGLGRLIHKAVHNNLEKNENCCRGGSCRCQVNHTQCPNTE